MSRLGIAKGRNARTTFRDAKLEFGEKPSVMDCMMSSLLLARTEHIRLPFSANDTKKGPN